MLYLRDVFGVGRFEKGVDAGVMRQLPTGEGGDGFVFDAVGPGEAHAQRPLGFLDPAICGQIGRGHHGFPALQLGEVGVMLAALFSSRIGWVV